MGEADPGTEHTCRLTLRTRYRRDAAKPHPGQVCDLEWQARLSRSRNRWPKNFAQMAAEPPLPPPSRRVFQLRTFGTGSKWPVPNVDERQLARVRATLRATPRFGTAACWQACRPVPCARSQETGHEFGGPLADPAAFDVSRTIGPSHTDSDKAPRGYAARRHKEQSPDRHRRSGLTGSNRACVALARHCASKPLLRNDFWIRGCGGRI